MWGGRGGDCEWGIRLDHLFHHEALILCLYPLRSHTLVVVHILSHSNVRSSTRKKKTRAVSICLSETLRHRNN